MILAGLHFGPMASFQHALTLRLAADGARLYIARWDKIEPGKVTTGSRARYLPAKVARLERDGARFVGRGGAYAIFRELLARGETCWLAIDTAATKRGRVEHFVNREVRFATGLVSLALETGATIIPAHAIRDGNRPARQAARADRRRRFRRRRGAPRPSRRDRLEGRARAPAPGDARPHRGDGLGQGRPGIGLAA